MAEEWRPVVGYEGLYEVSDLGRARRVAPGGSSRPGRVLRPFCNKFGYVRYCMCRSGTKRFISAHRLVAIAFIENPDGFRTVNHIDGCKANNSSHNLEWMSQGDNNCHAFAIGLKDSRGHRNPNHKVNEKQVMVIRRCCELRLPHKYIAETFGVGVRAVANIHHRRTWSHV